MIEKIVRDTDGRYQIYQFDNSSGKDVLVRILDLTEDEILARGHGKREIGYSQLIAPRKGR